MAATGPPSPQEASSSASADAAKNGTAAADASSSQSSSQSAAAPPAGDKTANDTSHAPTTQPAPHAAASKPATAAMPTYLSAKSQRAYTLSRELLTTGQLDDALETLELGLQLSRRVLDAPNANNGDTKNDDDEVSYVGCDISRSEYHGKKNEYSFIGPFPACWRHFYAHIPCVVSSSLI